MCACTCVYVAYTVCLRHYVTHTERERERERERDQSKARRSWCRSRDLASIIIYAVCMITHTHTHTYTNTHTHTIHTFANVSYNTHHLDSHNHAPTPPPYPPPHPSSGQVEARSERVCSNGCNDNRSRQGLCIADHRYDLLCRSIACYSINYTPSDLQAARGGRGEREGGEREAEQRRAGNARAPRDFVHRECGLGGLVWLC